jgi:hypothetical protein
MPLVLTLVLSMNLVQAKATQLFTLFDGSGLYSTIKHTPAR